MNDLLVQELQLQEAAAIMLANTPLLHLLSELGEPIQTGSSKTGLMVYPDIDFNIQAEKPNFQDAIDLVPKAVQRLHATACKIANFRNDDDESASYYIGFEFDYDGRTWQVAATVTTPGTIITSPPELAKWIAKMTDAERLTILQIKKQLIDTKRYAGAKSQPPFTFRSVHVYEAVLVGKAKTITDIEAYFA